MEFQLAVWNIWKDLHASIEPLKGQYNQKKTHCVRFIGIFVSLLSKKVIKFAPKTTCYDLMIGLQVFELLLVFELSDFLDLKKALK